MLVFGHLERRTFKTEIKNNAKDDATGVVYIPGVCIGAFLPCTLLGLYTRSVGITLLVYTQWFFLQPQTTDG